MKDITPIPKEIYDAFEKASPMFLVIGIRKQQFAANQPPQHKNVSFHVGSIDELMTAITQEGLQRFTAYQINGTFSSEAQLKNDAEKFAKEQEESQARQVYEKLKARFESKMAVVQG